MSGAVPVDIDKAAHTGAPPPSGLAADERQAYDQLAFFYQHGLGYALDMGNRPQTGVSSARLYWENKLAFFAPKHVGILVAVSVFPDELYPAPRSWAERAYPKLIHYNKLDKGGHFAAWEQHELLAAELRAGFRSLREAH
jgi:pimeloyl-ACP methyl ester carboxylesterase